MAKKDEKQESQQKKGSSMVKILALGLGGALMLGGGAAAGLYFTGMLDGLLGNATAVAAEGAPQAPSVPLDPAEYLPLDPPFVVNFDDQGMLRYLQVSVSVMARDGEVIKAVRNHNPRIRNDLIVLLGGQDFATLSSAEGKERLRVAALEKVQEIIQGEIGRQGVEQVYFTNFVMQ
ncbi:MAG: flagellar basal body-associated FliL family protein [Candidatus Competibacteraceae bacterium]|nr:flagellar basal body-associated FliL family protein [Candidatus Competibacteraceae bacterium]